MLQVIYDEEKENPLYELSKKESQYKRIQVLKTTTISGFSFEIRVDAYGDDEFAPIDSGESIILSSEDVVNLITTLQKSIGINL